MRFNSPDSLSPFDEGGLNAYAYCQGDPVNYRDPTGHIPYGVFAKALGFERHKPWHVKKFGTFRKAQINQRKNAVLNTLDVSPVPTASGQVAGGTTASGLNVVQDPASSSVNAMRSNLKRSTSQERLGDMIFEKIDRHLIFPADTALLSDKEYLDRIKVFNNHYAGFSALSKSVADKAGVINRQIVHNEQMRDQWSGRLGKLKPDLRRKSLWRYNEKIHSLRKQGDGM